VDRVSPSTRRRRAPDSEAHASKRGELTSGKGRAAASIKANGLEVKTRKACSREFEPSGKWNQVHARCIVVGLLYFGIDVMAVDVESDRSFHARSAPAKKLLPMHPVSSPSVRSLRSLSIARREHHATNRVREPVRRTAREQDAKVGPGARRPKCPVGAAGEIRQACRDPLSHFDRTLGRRRPHRARSRSARTPPWARIDHKPQNHESSLGVRT